MGRKNRRRPVNAVPPMAAVKQRRKSSLLKHLIICAALGVLTFLAYSDSFHAGFVHDNRYIILADSRVHQASSENINSILEHSYWWPNFETGLYRPVTTLSYLLNYALLDNADRPEGYHWINFLLHFANVLLVYLLALRFLRKIPPAVLAAALWAVHPVLTESVTNIVGRADLLAAMAVLSGFLMYLKSTDSQSWRRYAWLAGVMAVTTIGVFSKESAVAILGVIVLYEVTWWDQRKQLRGLILGCAAIAPPLLVMWYVRAMVFAASSQPAQFPFVDNPLMGASFLTARLTAFGVMARYLWRLVMPVTLSTDYSYAQIPLASGSGWDWISWIVVLAVVIAVASQFRRNRLIFFFGAFAFVSFFPTSNLLLRIGTIMAERLMYLPAVGFVVCVVAILYSIGERIRVPLFAPAVICLIIVGFAARTWIRNEDWHNDLTLATATARSSPESFRSHYDLALALDQSDHTRSNIGQVIDEMEKSMAILNSLPDSENIAVVYLKAGSDYGEKADRLVRNGADGKPIITDESIRAYQKSLQILLRAAAIGKFQEDAYREQLRTSGKSAILPVELPQIYAQLAITYLRLGKYEDAYLAAVHARSLDPSKIQPYIIMGQTLAYGGHKEESAVALVEAMLLSGQRSILGMLDALYRSGVDREGCAMTQNANGAVLNNSCAVVHEETCRAWAEITQLNIQNNHRDIADEMRSRAIEHFGCAVNLQR
jgi:protein O-mannosyl-transferase